MKVLGVTDGIFKVVLYARIELRKVMRIGR